MGRPRVRGDIYGTVTGVGAFFPESTQNLNPPSGGKDCLPFPEMIKSYAVIKLIKALPISKRITSPLHVGGRCGGDAGWRLRR